MTVAAFSTEQLAPAVSRQDVVRCYEKILRRPPENDNVIDDHVQRSDSVIDLVETLFFSPENQDRLRRTESLSIEKCWRAEYLAKNMSPRAKRRCFLHHHATLDAQFSDDVLSSLLTDGVFLLELTSRMTVIVKQSVTVVEEGELSLELRDLDQPLYTLAFSFVPGALGSGSGTSILVSRMQGRAGHREALRAAARAMKDISAQAILFAALIGVASACNVYMILGVGARNHIWCCKDTFDIYQRAYDRFYQALGYSEDESGYYRVALPLLRKPIAEITPCHRSRASAKRRVKDAISEQASRSWQALQSKANDLVHPEKPRYTTPAAIGPTCGFESSVSLIRDAAAGEVLSPARWVFSS